MIYDHITNLGLYKGIHPNLDKALRYLEETDVGKLAVGTYEIDGKNAYLFIQENRLDDTSENRFEYHRRYLDCHLILEGAELIRYGCGAKTELVDFDEGKDIGFVSCQGRYDFDLVDSYCTLFFPGEAHQPNIFKAHLKAVRKCVIKVLMD